MFKTRRFLGLRATVLLFSALALMILNQQTTYLNKIRSQLTVVVLPVQLLIDKPMQFFQWVKTSFSNQQEILAENAQLRARQLLLQAKLQRLLALEKENLQLRELLSAASHFNTKMLIAQILDANFNPLTQEAILDKGEADGVSTGLPVLDAYGVVGQVISPGPYSSNVLLISDGRSAIPVQDNRNGIRGILTGTGYMDELTLLYTPGTADIAVGDLFVTSGLGGRFPFGYPVGNVISIKKAPGDRFASIRLKPSAHLNNVRLVVLMWPIEKPLLFMQNPFKK